MFGDYNMVYKVRNQYENTLQNMSCSFLTILHATVHVYAKTQKLEYQTTAHNLISHVSYSALNMVRVHCLTKSNNSFFEGRKKNNPQNIDFFVSKIIYCVV